MSDISITDWDNTTSIMDADNFQTNDGSTFRIATSQPVCTHENETGDRRYLFTYEDGSYLFFCESCRQSCRCATEAGGGLTLFASYQDIREATEQGWDGDVDNHRGHVGQNHIEDGVDQPGLPERNKRTHRMSPAEIWAS